MDVQWFGGNFNDKNMKKYHPKMCKSSWVWLSGCVSFHWLHFECIFYVLLMSKNDIFDYDQIRFVVDNKCDDKLERLCDCTHILISVSSVYDCGGCVCTIWVVVVLLTVHILITNEIIIWLQ